jgi:hypothetical protein
MGGTTDDGREVGRFVPVVGRSCADKLAGNAKAPTRGASAPGGTACFIPSSAPAKELAHGETEQQRNASSLFLYSSVALWLCDVDIKSGKAFAVCFCGSGMMMIPNPEKELAYGATEQRRGSMISVAPLLRMKPDLFADLV